MWNIVENRSDATSQRFVRIVCESRVNMFLSYVSAEQHIGFVFRATEQLDLVWRRRLDTGRTERGGES